MDQLKAFATTLESFVRAPTPDPQLSPQQADRDLNKAYKEALAKDLSYTTIDAEGIRATERAWLRYRDAWATLGTLRYQTVAAEAW